MQPARAEEDEFRKISVIVSYSGSELKFADTPPIRLEEMDILVLHFQGISSDMVPGVTFSGPGVLVSLLGPFQEALQTPDQIILRGNSGLTGTFQCKALLSPKLRGEEPPLSSSNELRIDNAQNALSAKELRVLIRRKTDLSPVPVKVEVEPEIVALVAPDPVVWNFVFEGGLNPLDYTPLLYHVPKPSLPPGIGPFGPFRSLSVAEIFEPLADGSTLGYRLITSGNNDVHHRFHFSVGVRPTREGKSNEILAVKDPIIDNIGPPHQGSAG